MIQEHKITFDHIFVANRWKQRRFSRNGDWVIIGIQEYYASPTAFCYKLCLFGIDIQFWFKKHFRD